MTNATIRVRSQDPKARIEVRGVDFHRRRALVRENASDHGRPIVLRRCLTSPAHGTSHPDGGTTDAGRRRQSFATVMETRTCEARDLMEFVFAYIDPGSGSLIIQAVIAGLVAVPVLFRNQIRRLAGSLRGSSDNGEADSSTSKRRTEA